MFTGTTGRAEIAEGLHEGRKDLKELREKEEEPERERTSHKKGRKKTKSFQDTKVRGGIF